MADKQLQTRDQREVTVAQALQDKKWIAELQRAAPRDVDAGRVARIVLTEVRNRPELQNCDRVSLLSAAMVCAQTGLEPGPIGHAAIVPYRGKAQWQAMYKGLMHLAYRSGQISHVAAGVVCENDEFEWVEGSDAFVRHRKFLLGPRGERIAAYAAIGVKDGGSVVRVEPIAEIERIRKQYSKTTRSDAPWVTEYEEMAAKTMLKRAMKYAPCSPEAKVAIGMDDIADTGKDQPSQLTEKDISELGSDTKVEHCDKALGTDGDETLLCSKPKGHDGECHP